jgi:hypothetical protein
MSSFTSHVQCLFCLLPAVYLVGCNASAEVDYIVDMPSQGIPAQPTVAIPITIVNGSEECLQIDKFLGSCTCVDVIPQSLFVPAGQSADVVANLDLSRTAHADDAAASIPFSVTIAPMSRRQHMPPISLRGQLVRSVSCDRAKVDFGRCTAGTRCEPQFLTINIISPIEDIRITCSDTLKAVLIDAHDASRRVVRLDFEPSLVEESQQYLGQVMVATTTIDGQHHETRVPVIAQIDSDLSVSPQPIVLRLENGEAEAQLTYWSVEKEVWRLDEITSDRDRVHVVPLPSSSSKTCLKFQFGDGATLRQGHIHLCFSNDRGQRRRLRVPWVIISESLGRILGE